MPPYQLRHQYWCSWYVWHNIQWLPFNLYGHGFWRTPPGNQRCGADLLMMSLLSGPRRPTARISRLPPTPQQTESFNPAHCRERVIGQDCMKASTSILTQTTRPGLKRGIIQYLRHEAEKVCDGSIQWPEIRYFRQVFKAERYLEAVVKRNLRARPSPANSSQTSQPAPKLLLLS